MRSIDDVLYMRRIDRVALDVRTDRQGDGPVGIDVVRAVLGIVLDHEDGHLLPEPALGEALDEPAQRQVVVADAGRHGPLAGRCARGVVVGQAEDDQPGHLAGLLEPGQLLQEAVGAFDVGIVHVEAAEHRDRSDPRGP